MIDNNLKPWLIEINGPPQLTIDRNAGNEKASVDVRVKYPLIRDMTRVLFETDKSNISNFCQQKNEIKNLSPQRTVT